MIGLDRNIFAITINMATAEQIMSVKDSTLVKPIAKQLVTSKAAVIDILSSANSMQAKVFASLEILASMITRPLIKTNPSGLNLKT